MKVVIDTNVLVSALFTPMGTSSKALKIIMDYGRILYDSRIFTEYRLVLHREEFEFNENDVFNLLDFFRSKGINVPNPIPLPISKFKDRHDAPFLEVAVSEQVDFLITGNKRHFPGALAGGVKILSPGDFLRVNDT